MKKRLVALVSTVLLVACMSMTTFAATNPSVSAGGQSGSSSTTGTTSPTTGEPISLMVAGASMIIGAAGVVVSKKRA
jgi:LPXTG-motif cell wall-anchored protein